MEVRAKVSMRLQRAGTHSMMGSRMMNGDADRPLRKAANSARPDILYIAHRFPYPPDKGDRIRTFHLVTELSRRASIHLACLADEPPDESAVAALRRYCKNVA